MTLPIGTTIKNLRTQTKVTQDQLAVHLGVTPQAISRWEAENGYPDIELLPSIAAFFGITTDELLGVRQEERQARRAEIYRLIDEQEEIGNDRKAIPQARQFVAEFPADERIQLHLANLLCRTYMWGEHPDTDALAEAERIYLTLMERASTIDFRNEVIEKLAALYAVGFKDMVRAERITAELASMRYSREEVRSQLAGTAAVAGAEPRLEYMQEYIDRLTDTLASRLAAYTIDCVPNNAERWDEKIAVFEKLIDLYKLVYGENMLYHHGRVAYLYRVIATYKVAQKKFDETLDCLERMCEHAVRAGEAKLGDRFTSPFTDRLVYPEACEDFDDLVVHNHAWYCRQRMEQNRYDPIRKDPRFAAILAKLSETAR